ncbi:MAG: hypothetical protein Q9168_008075 [Polycauliona sp. 1 TL-2023]
MTSSNITNQPTITLEQACPSCGADITNLLQQLAQSTQSRISELEAQVRILTDKATAAAPPNLAPNPPTTSTLTTTTPLLPQTPPIQSSHRSKPVSPLSSLPPAAPHRNPHPPLPPRNSRIPNPCANPRPKPIKKYHLRVIITQPPTPSSPQTYTLYSITNAPCASPPKQISVIHKPKWKIYQRRCSRKLMSWLRRNGGSCTC